MFYFIFLRSIIVNALYYFNNKYHTIKFKLCLFLNKSVSYVVKKLEHFVYKIQVLSFCF